MRFAPSATHNVNGPRIDVDCGWHCFCEPPVECIIWQDTFDDPATLTDWTQLSGTWNIAGGSLTGQGVIRHNTPADEDEYSLFWSGGSTVGNAGGAVEISDANNFIWGEFVQGDGFLTPDFVRIYKRTGGVDQLIAESERVDGRGPIFHHLCVRNEEIRYSVFRTVDEVQTAVAREAAGGVRLAGFYAQSTRSFDSANLQRPPEECIQCPSDCTICNPRYVEIEMLLSPAQGNCGVGTNPGCATNCATSFPAGAKYLLSRGPIVLPNGIDNCGTIPNQPCVWSIQGITECSETVAVNDFCNELGWHVWRNEVTKIWTVQMFIFEAGFPDVDCSVGSWQVSQSDADCLAGNTADGVSVGGIPIQFGLASGCQWTTSGDGVTPEIRLRPVHV